MQSIPYIAAHLEKKAGKEEAFHIVKKAINGVVLTNDDLAVLYSYFLPPQAKKITNPYEWASIVCDQKEQYSFCKYLLVDGQRILAANTKTAHIIWGNLGMDSGWHDTQKGKTGDDVAIMPNIDQAIKDAVGFEFDFEKDEFDNGLFDIIDTPTGLSYVLPWNQKGVSKKYLDLTINALDNIKIEYSEDGPFRIDGNIRETKCTAIVMPFETNGYINMKVEKERMNQEHEQLTF